MSKSFNTSLENAIRTLARPLVRMLLRAGITVQSLMEIMKQLYVEVAMNEFSLPGKAPSQSRVSIITGLTRKEVQRIVNLNSEEDSSREPQHHRAASVIAGWVRDEQYHDQEKKPRVLPVAGGDGSFTDLVRRYSGDMPVRAMLDELIRVGAVKSIDKNHVQLIERSYIPAKGDVEKVYMLGTDVADLIETIDHNIQTDSPTTESPRFQRKVMYDNLPQEAVEQFRKLSAIRSQQLIEEFDQWLAQHDRDLNPSVTGHGKARAGIGIYYFEDVFSEENKHEHVA